MRNTIGLIILVFGIGLNSCKILFSEKSNSDDLRRLQTLLLLSSFGNANTSSGYVVFKTGQTTSYETGDDGTHQAGTTKNYTDNTDETIKDNITGITWQKCSAGLSGANCTIGSATTYNWTDAESYCTGLSLASKTWKLPNLKNLNDLADYSLSSSPSINATLFPNTVSGNYWSSTLNAANSSSAWIIGFMAGDSGNFAKTNSYNVRCISGQ